MLGQGAGVGHGDLERAGATSVPHRRTTRVQSQHKTGGESSGQSHTQQMLQGWAGVCGEGFRMLWLPGSGVLEGPWSTWHS